jgi:hypothetical protein
MPTFMRLLMIIGTAAMLWVGGSIVIHGLEEIGFGTIGHLIHDWAYAFGHMVPESWSGAVKWIATAFMDGVFGLALGFVLIPVVTKALLPMWRAVSGRSAAH